MASDSTAAERFKRIDEQRSLLEAGRRRCTRCQRIFPATLDFYSPASRAHPGTLSSWCKQCHRDAYRERQLSADPTRREYYEYIDQRAELTSAGERLCRACQRVFPDRDEFFYRDTSGRLVSPCKACAMQTARTSYRNARTPAQLEASADRIRLKRAGLKRCPACGRELPADEVHWHRSTHSSDGFVGYCVDCMASRGRDEKLQLKQRVIGHYGGRCVCCGESDLVVLTIDHVADDGAEHRRANRLMPGWQTYAWIERQGYPQGPFQVLCNNCNAGRAHNKGVCPHVRPVVPPPLALPCATCGRPSDSRRPLCKQCLEAVRAENGGTYPRITRCIVCGTDIEQSKTAAKMLCADCARDRIRKLVRNHMRNRRLKVVSHYSGGSPRCAVCGESEYGFLAIDHVASDGADHRRGDRSAARLDSWLLSHGLPEGFQVLCYNCNWKKYVAAGLGL